MAHQNLRVEVMTHTSRGSLSLGDDAGSSEVGSSSTQGLMGGGARPTATKLGPKKAALLLLLLGAVIFIIADYTSAGHINSALTSFLNWVEQNPAAGAFAFAGVYIVCTVFFIPGSLLTLGAGYVFSRAVGQGPGIALAILAVWVGATVGACLAFLLGRFVLRDAAASWYAKFRVMAAIDRAVAVQGLKVVTLLRLSPVVPFAPLNYVLGLTSVAFREYAVATAWGIVPGTAAFVFIGSTVNSVGDSGDGGGGSGGAKIAVYVVGALATLGAVVLISRFASRALKDALAETDEAAAEAALAEGGAAPANMTATGVDVAVAEREAGLTLSGTVAASA